LGVVFCGLFRLRLDLDPGASDHVDLDPDCVLYGSIETSVVDAGRVPRVALISAGLLAANALPTALFYNEPAWPRSIRLGHDARIQCGDYPPRPHAGRSVTTVLAFESVGSILVIAMLVVPAAAASLLTRRLHLVLVGPLLRGGERGLGHLGAITLPRIVGLSLGYPEPGLPVPPP
jgi:manganese/zinc/iron transport system permease protein